MKRALIALLGILLTVNLTVSQIVPREVANHATIRNLAKEEIKCLADNIYFEARGEPLRGQIAVAAVTVNRLGIWSKTICGVVHQRSQFSWTLSPSRRVDKATYKKSMDVAVMYLLRHYEDPTSGSTFFHVQNIKPRWSHSMEFTTWINNHKFYRIPIK